MVKRSQRSQVRLRGHPEASLVPIWGGLGGCVPLEGESREHPGHTGENMAPWGSAGQCSSGYRSFLPRLLPSWPYSRYAEEEKEWIDEWMDGWETRWLVLNVVLDGLDDKDRLSHSGWHYWKYSTVCETWRKEKISRSFVTFIFAWKQSFLQNKVQKSSTNINSGNSYNKRNVLRCEWRNYSATFISSFCLRYFFIFNNLNIFLFPFWGLMIQKNKII